MLAYSLKGEPVGAATLKKSLNGVSKRGYGDV